MAKMGRPKKAPKERQSKQIAIRVTAAEYGKLKRAAGNAEISDYIRQKLSLRGEKMNRRPLKQMTIAKLRKTAALGKYVTKFAAEMGKLGERITSKANAAAARKRAADREKR